MGELIFFGLIVLAIPLVPFVLSIRAYMRIGRMERSIEDLAQRVDRLYAAAVAGQQRELREARAEAAANEARVPVIPAPEAPLPPVGGSHMAAEPPASPRVIEEIPQPILAASPGAPRAASRGFRLQAEDRPPAEDQDSFETMIGTRWLLYVGIVAIVIGAAYFEKLAIERGWIGETARVLQGGVVGLALVYIGTRFVRAGYSLYGQMISGGGAAILYVSTYAAFNFYHLIDRPAAFVLLVAITAMTAGLADRQRSQGLAVLAVGGGFGTPFLLPSGSDAQIALFGYDAILVAGTMYLAHRRNWPLLNVVSYVFTLLTIAGWADRFYTREKYLRTELFLTLFCGMFLYILHECRRSKSDGAQMAALLLWTAPAAYYVSSLIVLAPHQTAMLVWLVAVMLAGGMASVVFGVVAGIAVWAAVTVPLLIWAVQHPGAQWLVPGLAATGGIYVIALAVQLRAVLEDERLDPAVVIWLHLNGLLMFASAYFLIEPIRVAFTAPVAAAFAAWNGALAAFLLSRRREYAIHFLALAFTLLSVAIALQFDGPAVTVGWAAEGAAIIALGLRERRDWLRLGGLALFAVAVARAIEMLTQLAPINQIVFLNLRALSAAFVTALCYVLAWLHRREPDAPERDAAIGLSLIVAQFLGLAILTSEINAYWRGRNDHLAQEAMVSVTWALYSTVLVVVGLRRHYAPIRYFAMVVFAVTTAKVFFVDLAELDRIYRVMSVIGLGILLLLTSWLYQRSRSEGGLNSES